MASSDDSRETEKLAVEIAQLTGESEEEVVLGSLREWREQLGAPRRPKPKTLEEAVHVMETRIWPLLPDRPRGGPPMTKVERAKLVGYGPDD